MACLSVPGTYASGWGGRDSHTAAAPPRQTSRASFQAVLSQQGFRELAEVLGWRHHQGSKGSPPSEDHVHICFEKKSQVKRNSKCHFQSLASFNSGSPSCQEVILVASNSSVHYLAPFDKCSEPLYSVVGKSAVVKSPVFLGVMPQSLHIWIWRCSDRLLCRASQVPSGWMGANCFCKTLTSCVSVEDTGGLLQQVCLTKTCFPAQLGWPAELQSSTIWTH